MQCDCIENSLPTREANTLLYKNSLWTLIFKLAAGLNIFFWAFCFLFSMIIFDNPIAPTQPSAKQCSGKSIALTPQKSAVVYFLLCLTLLPLLLPRKPQTWDIIEDKSRISTFLKMKKTLIHSSDSVSGLTLKPFSLHNHPMQNDHPRWFHLTVHR